MPGAQRASCARRLLFWVLKRQVGRELFRFVTPPMVLVAVALVSRALRFAGAGGGPRWLRLASRVWLQVLLGRTAARRTLAATR